MSWDPHFLDSATQALWRDQPPSHPVTVDGAGLAEYDNHAAIAPKRVPEGIAGYADTCLFRNCFDVREGER